MFSKKDFSDVIVESVVSLLNEVHHASDENDLQKQTVETAKYLIQNADKIISAYENEFIIHIPKNLLHVNFSDGTSCGYQPNTNSVSLGIECIKDAAKTNDVRRLASLLYHELGHRTNVVKSNKASSEIEKDFLQPFFIRMGKDEYRDTLSTIYLFYSRELKARCFEATMFLKQSKTLPSLEEYYSDRCTNITKMRSFIQRLETVAKQGKDGPDSYLITDIAREMNRKKRGNTHKPMSPSFNSQARMVLGWFYRQFEWFKKRVDKIYADFKTLKIGEKV